MDWLNSSGYIFIHPAANPPFNGTCFIEKLPAELINSITTYVSIYDKISLSLVDKFFRKSVFDSLFTAIKIEDTNTPVHDSYFDSVAK